MNTALDGSTTVITPASTVTDEPTTFAYGDQIYEPRNYKEEYHGDVTARYALAMSLNNATVKWPKKWATTKWRTWRDRPASSR